MPRPRNRLLPGPFRPAILLPMTWWEKAVLLAFVAGVAIVFGGSTLILARALVRLVLRRPAPRLSHRVRWTHRILLALAGVGAACIAYGWLVEPYRLTQTRLRIECPKLPAGSSPPPRRLPQRPPLRLHPPPGGPDRRGDRRFQARPDPLRRRRPQPGRRAGQPPPLPGPTGPHRARLRRPRQLGLPPAHRRVLPRGQRHPADPRGGNPGTRRHAGPAGGP